MRRREEMKGRGRGEERRKEQEIAREGKAELAIGVFAGPGNVELREAG